MRPVSLGILEDELALEVLRSEKLRVTILICAIVGAIVFLNVLPLLLLDQFQRAFHGNFRPIQVYKLA